MPSATLPSSDTAAFHARLVERRVNEVLGGDATIRELVVLMVEMGWTPPAEPRTPDAERVRCAESVTNG